MWFGRLDYFGFVYLTFSTSNSAFVAPADIQAFTIEAKNKLSARCRGKTVKYFAQAVREICEEFEQLQQKSSSCFRDDENQSAPGSDVHFADGAVDDAVETGLKDGNGKEGTKQQIEIRSLGDRSSGLGRCSQRQGETDYKSIKICASDGERGSLKRNKFSTDSANLLREAVSTSSSNSESSHKESSCDKNEECSSRKMNHRGGSKGGENSYFPAVGDHQEYHDDTEDLINGHRSRLDAGSKRKGEGSCEMHDIGGAVGPTTMVHNNSSSSIDLSLSNQKSGSYIQKKNASRGKGSSQNVMKADGGKKANKLFGDKKNFEEKVKSQLDVEESISKDKVELSGKRQGHGKQKSNELSHPAKRSKSVDVTDGSKGLLQNSRKVESQSQNDKVVTLELERSVLRGKAENRLGFKPSSTTVDSNLSGDEDVLPPTKRRRRVLEAMSTTSAMCSENRIVRGSTTVKNDSRRRAVRLFDEDEEEEPKTPIHGGSTKKVLVNSHDQFSTKRGDIFYNQLGKRGSGTPENQSSKKLVPSGEKPVQYLSPNSQQMEKGHGKPVASRFSPGKVDAEKFSSKEGKQAPVSPATSLLSASAKLLVEPQKPNKLLGKVSGNISQRKTPSAFKDPVATSDSLNTSVNQLYERSKLDSSAEMDKATPKSHSKTNDLTFVQGFVMESHLLQGERY